MWINRYSKFVDRWKDGRDRRMNGWMDVLVKLTFIPSTKTILSSWSRVRTINSIFLPTWYSSEDFLISMSQASGSTDRSG